MKNIQQHPENTANSNILEVSNKEKTAKKSATKNKGAKSKDKQKLSAATTELDTSAVYQENSYNLIKQEIGIANNEEVSSPIESVADLILEEPKSNKEHIDSCSAEEIESITKAIEYFNHKFRCNPIGYPYRDKSGIIVSWVMRWDPVDASGKKKKEIRPFIFDVKKQKWESKALSKPRPLYNLLGLVSKPDAPVLIVEGEKTVEAGKQLFPSFVVVTSCGGANQANQTDWSVLEGRDIIIAPDNDKAGKDYAQAVIKRCEKSGYIKSLKLLKPTTLGKYVIEDSKWVERKVDVPEGYDLADSLAEGWTPKLIEQAMSDERFAPFFQDQKIKKIIKGEVYENEEVLELKNYTFKLGKKTLYLESFISDENDPLTPKQIWIPFCGYLKVTHHIRDITSGNWGILLQLIDLDNKKKDIIIHRKDLVNDKAALQILLENGLEVFNLKYIAPKITIYDLINDFINSSNPQARAIGVDKVGWHGNCYLLPFIDDARNSYLVPDAEQVNTGQREEYVLQSNSENPRKLIRQGTIKGWKDSIGKFASGNNLLMFSIATAIAAPLFSIFSEEGCCFHFSGSSSVGKTTALYVASSVWGMGKPSSFRTTDNAAESLCKNSNDGLLLMDELAEIDPNSLEKITYLFGNGTGKGRAKQSGEAKSITTFKILGLSTGEIGLQAKLNEKGKNTTAGQSVRFIEISADSGKGLGIFDTLHHFENGRDLSDYLRKECQNCGVVIDEWMQYISSNFNDLQKAIISTNKTWLDKYLPQNSDPQVQRVGKKFALIAAIGETSIAAGILPFAQGAISEACKVLFDRWLEQRGNNGSHEFQGIIERLKMLTQEGINSRFLDADGGNDENKNIQKLAGYKKCRKENIKDPENGTSKDDSVITEFWILPEVFQREILENRSYKIFCKQLIENGYLLPDKQGKSQQSKRVAKQKPRKFYVVPADKISD